jgi:hypothetical protein
LKPGIQAYTGKWAFEGNFRCKDKQYFDQRVAVSFIIQNHLVFKQNNIGKGPRYNKITNSVDVSSLEGGYVTLNYMGFTKNQLLYPLLNFNTMTVERNLKRCQKLHG